MQDSIAPTTTASANMPASAATSLQVATPPLADTARYDRLRPHDGAEEIGHA